MQGRDDPLDDDGLDEIVDRIALGGPRLEEPDPSRYTRGDEVRAAVRLAGELTVLTSTPGGEWRAAQTYEASIGGVAIDEAVLEWGARLGWPGKTGAIGNSNAFQNPTRRAVPTILRPKAHRRRLVPPKPSNHVNLGRTHAPRSRRDA